MTFTGAEHPTDKPGSPATPMASDGDSRYAPPTANVADVADPNAVVLASRWSRLFAAMLDGLVMAVPLVLFGIVLAATGGAAWYAQRFGPVQGSPFSPRPLGALLGLALFLLINGYLLVDRGQTVGKIALGVRIVRRDGSKASALRILGLRYGVGFLMNLLPVVNMLYGLIDHLLIFRRSRRCLHDEIADTVVVRA